MERQNFVEGFKKISRSEYAKTALELLTFETVAITAGAVLSKANVPVTRLSFEIIRKNLLYANLIGPVTEEVRFRLLPDLFLKRDKSPQWALGLASSIAFAKEHEEEDKITLPIVHLAGGLFLWRIMRKRGISHAIAAHMLNNLIASAAAIASINGKTTY